jgi:hypothetical protein
LLSSSPTTTTPPILALHDGVPGARQSFGTEGKVIIIAVTITM